MVHASPSELMEADTVAADQCTVVLSFESCLAGLTARRWVLNMQQLHGSRVLFGSAYEQ